MDKFTIIAGCAIVAFLCAYLYFNATFREECAAMGGEAITTRSGNLCLKPDSIIMEQGFFFGH